jgi:hypothetical protein
MLLEKRKTQNSALVFTPLKGEGAKQGTADLKRVK